MINQQIIVICNDRFPSTIAHGVYLARLCESLSFSGADVELIVPKRFKEVHVDPFEYYDIKNHFRLTKIWSFDFIIFAKYLPGFAYWTQYFNFYLFTFFYLFFHSRKKVIYTMDYFGPTLSLLGFKVFFEAHQWNKRYAGILGLILKLARKIVVTNSFICKHFRDAGFNDKPILIAPNGVSLDRFVSGDSLDLVKKSLSIPVSKKVISYIGKYKTLGSEKGVRELIIATANLSRKYSNIFLLLVGMTEEEKNEVVSLCVLAGLNSDSFLVVTLVPQKKVSDYFKASDLFVMNYPKTEHYSFNMSPMKMFEYMASRRPIVATDLPAIREVLDDSMAVFVTPDDVSSLEKGIEKILLEAKLAETLVTNAYQRVTEFTWEKRARRILDFISSVV